MQNLIGNLCRFADRRGNAYRLKADAEDAALFHVPVNQLELYFAEKGTGRSGGAWEGGVFWGKQIASNTAP